MSTVRAQCQQYAMRMRTAGKNSAVNSMHNNRFYVLRGTRIRENTGIRGIRNIKMRTSVRGSRVWSTIAFIIFIFLGSVNLSDVRMMKSIFSRYSFWCLKFQHFLQKKAKYKFMYNHETCIRLTERRFCACSHASGSSCNQGFALNCANWSTVMLDSAGHWLDVGVPITLDWGRREIIQLPGATVNWKHVSDQGLPLVLVRTGGLIHIQTVSSQTCSR